MDETSLLGLADRIALVTAAGMGIGHATAIQLARAGCHVAAIDVDPDGARATAEQVAALGRRSLAIGADATDRDAVHRGIGRIRDELGPLDVAVNVVGGSLIRKAFLDLTPDDWQRVLDLNLMSTVVCCQAEAIAMVEDERPGRIVNVSSSSGITAAPTIAPYGAAKAAVIHLTKSIAAELAPYGIRVNCVVPGTHDSPRTRRLATDPSQPEAVRDFWRLAAKAPPLGRLGDPLETAGTAVYLASDLSSYVTGHIAISDGGILNTTSRPPVGGEMRPQALRRESDLTA